jgi:hypothetical protein
MTGDTDRGSKTRAPRLAARRSVSRKCFVPGAREMRRARAEAATLSTALVIDEGPSRPD